MLDVLLLLLAFAFAPPMLYGIWAGRQRAQGVEVPAFGELLRAAWAVVVPVLRGVAWVAGFVLAPARQRGPAPWAYVEGAPVEPVLEQRDAPSVRPSAPSALIELALLDIGDRRDRAAALTMLVALGWTTAEIRSVVKGENAAIGAEVDAARRRLGADAPPRFVTIAGGKGGRVAI